MFGWFRKPSPEEKEIARCAALQENGRRVEGYLLDIEDQTVFYRYEVRGVTYQTAQDFRLMKCALPEDRSGLLGPVTVQYATANPANSMVVLQEKSGTKEEKSMILNAIKKSLVAMALAGALLTAPAVAANKPKTVIHVINVKFKADASPASIQQAIDGIYSIVGKYKGVKNVWLKPIKVQGGAAKFTHCLVMEFESEASLAAYTGSPEQKEWYKLWEAVRELSNTHDVTN